MVSRAYIYAVLNSEIVVDIYQLMELLVDQAVADLSMDECKYAPIFLARGHEKESAFAQKVYVSDSVVAAVSRPIILSNAVLKAFN
jgi:hypothetical protein